MSVGFFNTMKGMIYMKKKYQIIGMIVMFICAIIYQFQKPEQIETNSQEASSYVMLEGAFLKEGKYEFDGEMTVEQLVQEVGVKENANMEAVNLQAPLKDESTLYLPLQSDTTISLNNATKEELMTLKGIGEKTAQKIVDYRNEQPFLYIEDIMNISGIGEKTYMKLRDSLCL